jgi:preprotein translocase subunit SecE
MTIFTVVGVISLILFKGGDTSLDNALAETMGPNREQFLHITRIFLIVLVFVLLPVSMIFEVLDKKQAGEPYKKTVIDNIAVMVFLAALALFWYFNGNLFT